MEQTDRRLENGARRAAKRLGYKARKSREHSLHMNNLGGFRIVDPNRNCVVAGEKFNMSAEEVIAWCEEAGRRVSLSITRSRGRSNGR